MNRSCKSKPILDPTNPLIYLKKTQSQSHSSGVIFIELKENIVGLNNLFLLCFWQG